MKLSLVSSYSLLERLYQAKQDFKGTTFEEKVRQAMNLYLEKRYVDLEQVLNTLPTREQLLEGLIEKLKEKPVYKTLRKISDNKTDNVWETLKGLFSLGTHICIELEKGNLEYRGILCDVYEKIGRILFEVEEHSYV